MPAKYVNGKVQYLLTKKNDFFATIQTCINAGISAIRINQTKHNFTLSEGKKIVELCAANSVDVIIENNADFAVAIGANGVFITDPKQAVSAIKKLYPNLFIGGKAYTMADCKNWELQKIAYIELVPNEGVTTTQKSATPLGAELFQTIIPKEESYGWMILSLNLPVIISGIYSFQNLKKMADHADISGVLITDNFEPQLPMKNRVDKILEILI